MEVSNRKIKELRNAIGVGKGVAEELLVLAGGDTELAIDCSKASAGLDQCKAAIINARFQFLEDELFED